MRTHRLTASLLLFVPLATGCARAGAQTSTAAAPPPTVIGVAGDCPADAGPMRPDPADVMADRNGDGYVCTLQIRSMTGDTLRLAVDNDAPSLDIQPEPYIGM
ncbi:MAG TPA: hypothetical protein VGJ80_00240 [Gemmatimonadales bacterium]|jgi:hypothetical protein